MANIHEDNESCKERMKELIRKGKDRTEIIKVCKNKTVKCYEMDLFLFLSTSFNKTFLSLKLFGVTSTYSSF